MVGSRESKKVEKTKGEGYSVWMVPPEPVYSKVERAIRSLHSEFSDQHLKYQAPYFEPHVTLMSALLGSEDDIIAKTERLSHSLRQFEIGLDAIADLNDEYFKCVFVKAKQTKELMAANASARRTFNKLGDPPYVPHVSLVYGFFPGSTRMKIISEVRKANPDICSYAYKVSRLSLYLTDGPVDKWYKIRDLELSM